VLARVKSPVGFIVGCQDEKLRGMCSVAAIYPRDSRDIGGDAQSGDPGNSKMARSTVHFGMEIRIRFGAHRPGTQKVLELC